MTEVTLEVVDISHGIKVGGFDYTVDMSRNAHDILRANTRAGEYDHINTIIRIESDLTPPQLSQTFIHEVIEAVNHIYCNDTIEHEKIQQLSFGVHQVCESLGIRFGVRFGLEKK